MAAEAAHDAAVAAARVRVVLALVQAAPAACAELVVTPVPADVVVGPVTLLVPWLVCGCFLRSQDGCLLGPQKNQGQDDPSHTQDGLQVLLGTPSVMLLEAAPPLPVRELLGARPEDRAAGRGSWDPL